MLTRRRLAAALAGAGVFAPRAAFAQAQAEPPGDPRLANHPRMAEALAHLRARRWRALAQIVRAQTPDGACVLLGNLGDQSEVDLDLVGLERQPMGRTIKGALLVDWGWRYRGSGMSSTVTDEMFNAFEARLTRARTELEAAVAQDGDDGVAFTFLIRLLKGLSQVPAMSAAWEAFQGAARKPIRAYSGYADALAAKWFGSHDFMVAFARLNQEALLPASRALVVQAYHEIIFSLMRGGDAQAGFAFAMQPSVFDEVAAANEAFHAGPVTDDFYQRAFAHAQFSFFFSLVGMNDLARPHMVALGQWIGGPWTLFPDPPGLFERYRQTLGLSAT